jgi:hypothetical protein
MIEDRTAAQRTFYLRMSPHIGHNLASILGGFISPGRDGMESDLRDTLKLWMGMNVSGAFTAIQDTSWWMTRLTDRYGRLSKEETNQKSDEYTCYAIATIGALMDKGILQFVTPPETPDIVTSDYDPGNKDIVQAILDRMEATLDNDEETDL